MGFFECFRLWCAIHKFDELWRVECDSIENDYLQAVELRGIDAGHEVLHVIAIPFEHKICENREDSACQGTSAFLVRGRLRGSEFKD